MHNSNKTQNKSNSLHLLDFYLPDILFYYFLVEALPVRIYLLVLFDVVWLLVGNFDPTFFSAGYVLVLFARVPEGLISGFLRCLCQQSFVAILFLWIKQ